MKKLLKKLTISIVALVVMLTSTICTVMVLGVNPSSTSLSFYNSELMSSTADLRSGEIDDSIFFVDLSLVRVSGNFIYAYDNADSTIKIIDKRTNTYKTINNHYRFYNLEELIIYNDIIMMFDGTEKIFKCINANTFEEVSFDQTLLTTLNETKFIKQIKINSEDYLLFCPANPISGSFELAKLTENQNELSVSNISTFKIDESWTASDILTSYNHILVTQTPSNMLFIMIITDSKIYSFSVDPQNISSEPYRTITTVSGLENVSDIQNIAQVSIDESNALALVADQKISLYNLDSENASLSEISDKTINLNSNFIVSDSHSDQSVLALISNETQSLKIIDFSNQSEPFYYESNVENEEITPYLYSAQQFKYYEITKDTPILALPYSKEGIILAKEDSQIVIIGEGKYSDQTSIIGWQYCMYSENNQNYYGYVLSIDITELESVDYSKHYVTVLGYTKLYSMPSKIADTTLNQELKSIVSNSRLEVISALCDYNSLDTEYLLVKVNGDTIGFIDRSRVLTSASIEDRIIPNATVKQDNSEIFTTNDDSKEVILTLNKGDRVKVIGKRDTVTNYTQVTFNDSDGNEYTGYIYTYNLESDSWSMLQIIGMFLVALNVIILIIMIILKNKIAR